MPYPNQHRREGRLDATAARIPSSTGLLAHYRSSEVAGVGVALPDDAVALTKWVPVVGDTDLINGGDGATLPTFRTANNTVRFGGDQEMQSAASLPRLLLPRTFALIGRAWAHTPGVDTPFAYYGAIGTNSAAFGFGITANHFGVLLGGATAYDLGTTVDTSPHLLWVIYDGTNLRMGFDGTYASGAVTLANSIGAGALRLQGATADGSTFDAYDVLVWNRALGRADINRLVAYKIARYGGT